MTQETQHKTSFSEDDQIDRNAKTKIAMSVQQKKYSSSSGALSVYKEFVYGDSSWPGFLSFEAYNLLFANLPSLIGYGFRRVCLPMFLKNCGRGVTLGKGLLVRQPKNISFGSNIIVDDYATLDVRTDKESRSEIQVGDHVFIGKHTIIAAKGGTITLGNACNISSSCRIATQSKVNIGESVLIAAYCYIGPGNHGVKDKETPIIEQEMENRGGVTIGDHAWIGTRATIVDGVTIGKHAVVGAHSLVLEDVPEGAVVAGSPAKVLRYRD